MRTRLLAPPLKRRPLPAGSVTQTGKTGEVAPCRFAWYSTQNATAHSFWWTSPIGRTECANFTVVQAMNAADNYHASNVRHLLGLTFVVTHVCCCCVPRACYELTTLCAQAWVHAVAQALGTSVLRVDWVARVLRLREHCR